MRLGRAAMLVRPYLVRTRDRYLIQCCEREVMGEGSESHAAGEDARASGLEPDRRHRCMRASARFLTDVKAGESSLEAVRTREGRRLSWTANGSLAMLLDAFRPSKGGTLSRA